VPGLQVWSTADPATLDGAALCIQAQAALADWSGDPVQLLPSTQACTLSAEDGEVRIVAHVLPGTASRPAREGGGVHRPPPGERGYLLRNIQMAT
jgi:hypothetical protein